jgi:hypothetical protein
LSRKSEYESNVNSNECSKRTPIFSDAELDIATEPFRSRARGEIDVST